METLGTSLSDQQVSLLERHYDLLQRWNQRISLTSVTEPGQIVERHFGESLFLASHLGSAHDSVIDIGSGAGFPGFPVAVACPALQVTLLESVRKKAVFLKELSREAANVRVLHSRLEDVPERFEWALARGVALGPLWPHLTRKANRLAVITGVDEAAELSGWAEATWNPLILLPWSPRRALLIGSFLGRHV